MELCDLSAVEVRELLLEKKVSALEVLEACQARIDAVDGRPGTLEPGLETRRRRPTSACLHHAHARTGARPGRSRGQEDCRG